MELLEGKLTLYYHPVNKIGEKAIDTFFEGFIQTNLKAFGYELTGSGMHEDGTREMKFDKLARNR
jgi:hypothetical protein